MTFKDWDLRTSIDQIRKEVREENQKLLPPFARLATGTFCGREDGEHGYLCTLEHCHSGELHMAHGILGKVVEVWR